MGALWANRYCEIGPVRLGQTTGRYDDVWIKIMADPARSWLSGSAIL